MEFDYINCLWYVKPNDLIGGWCIMPGDYTPGNAPYGIAEVADFITYEAAEHIVKLHNEWYPR